jgi:LacI family transcriptional regulator
MKATMRDVARHAGVSVATVSHVINNTRAVSDTVRKLVEDSVRALDYLPHQIGRSLKTGVRNLVGFVVPDIGNSIWSLIIEEVESVLSSFGYKLIIISTKETEEREVENLRILSSGIVDGIIVASTLPSFSGISAVVPRGLPLVFVDRVIEGCPCDTIVPQDFNAVYEGVERFILAGHKRIGIITGLIRLSTSRVRLDAYRKAMSDYGLPIEDGFVQFGNSLAKSAVPLAQAIIDRQCSALVVSNNVMASDVLHFLNLRNGHAGQELAILGQGVEGDLNYNLSRMDLIVQPSVEMGRAAGNQIIERIRNPQAPIKNVTMYTRLVPRVAIG